LETFNTFEGDVALESGCAFLDASGHDVEIRFWIGRIGEKCRPGVSKIDIVVGSLFIIDDL